MLKTRISCALCANEIAKDDGDVLFGDKWYHGACWLVLDNVAKEEIEIPRKIIAVKQRIA